MIFDTDDLHETNHRLDLLWRLHDANPLFRMTAFAVPAYCPPEFLRLLPDWIQVVPHGWAHGGPACTDPLEAQNWTYDDAIGVLAHAEGLGMEHGWKSPGWQISDGTYQALADLGWWVADQHYNDNRRPASLRVHCLGDGDHVHTHVQNWGSNGLHESWDSILAAVEQATSFELVSEVVRAPELVAA